MIPANPRNNDGGARLPVVVDLDGSLVRGDTTVGCIRALLPHPRLLAGALSRWRHGRAAVKAALAASAGFDPARLRYNTELLAYLRDQRAAGRPLILATGADRRIAEAVARHLGLFDLVLASDGRTNLTGRTKLAAIRRRLGAAPFAYVGNSRKDLAVWRDAAAAICVNARPAVARAAARATRLERCFPRQPRRPL
jgi:phosphoserine phosphatase